MITCPVRAFALCTIQRELLNVGFQEVAARHVRHPIETECLMFKAAISVCRRRSNHETIAPKPL